MADRADSFAALLRNMTNGGHIPAGKELYQRHIAMSSLASTSDRGEGEAAGGQRTAHPAVE
jgi:hypothetical protein